MYVQRLLCKRLSSTSCNFFFFFACLHRKHINICRNRSLKLLDKKKMKEKKKEDNSDDAPKTISQMVKERRKEKRK